MTASETAEIKALADKLDDLRGDLKDTLGWINGSPGVPGAREQIATIKLQLLALQEKSAARVTWAQCLLCGAGLVVAQVILNLILHAPK